MREAGFCCCGHKTSHCVDRHEDTDVVESRNACNVNCFDEELYEHCWVQLTKKVCLKMKGRKKREKLAERTKVKQEGMKITSKLEQCIDVFVAIERHLDSKAHHCVDPETGEEMVEAHADTVCSHNEEAANLPVGIPPLPDMGGHLSVRKPIGWRPHVPFGQDEAIYRSAQLNESCWMIDGQQTLRLKTEGKGRMVSAAGSREFGFGFCKITEEQMKTMNEERRGKRCADEDAATHLLGSPLKKNLEESPLIRMLECGAGKDGCWSHNHMVLQIEDCFDCFKMLDPECDMVWELDHSSGHGAELPAGLTTKQTGTIDGGLGWNHGGKKRHMRDSKLTANDVGTVHHARFKGTDVTQSMDFKEDDLPPVLDPDCPKCAMPAGETNTPEATVSELKKILEEKGLSADGKKPALIARCVGACSPLKVADILMRKGCVGQPKGAAHIGFERGFCDLDLLRPNGQKVSFQGKKLEGEQAEEPAANIVDHRTKKKRKIKRDLSTSVQHVLQMCHDFRRKSQGLSQLLRTSQLGAFVRLTPKCHPEIAGRGTEHAWGCSKLHCRRNINDAATAHLDANIKKALTRELLTTNRFRKHARKARDYELTRECIVDVTKAQDASAGKFRIEHITKLVKNHRSALDSDHGFIVNSK
jgi:hypothetical protein